MFAISVLLLAALAQEPSVIPQPQTTEQPSTAAARLLPSDIAQLKGKAESGDASAQVALGRAYSDGNGVAENDDLALKWFRKAAEQNSGDAENEIGILYRNGQGVEKSKEEAVNWYRKAAHHGNGAAMFNLGAAYYNGDGVPVDDESAYAWFTLAQQAGNKPAEDATKRMEGELSKWSKTQSLRTLAEIYMKGDVLQQNYSEAARWYRKAAEQGDRTAQMSLAAMLLKGQGVQKNEEEGFHWCNEAAKQRDELGSVCLGYLYQHGVGVKQDSRAALKAYLDAAYLGNAAAMHAVTDMYLNGEAGKADRPEAFVWMIRAARGGSTDAIKDAVKLRASMDPEEWKTTKKKLGQAGFKVENVERALQNAADKMAAGK